MISMKVHKKILLVLLLVLSHNIASSQEMNSTFPGSLEHLAKKTKVTVYYSKHTKHERLQELTSGFNTYITTRKINAIIHTVSVGVFSPKNFRQKLDLIKIVAPNTINRRYSDVIVASDLETHNLLCSLDSCQFNNIPVITICTLGSDIRSTPKNTIFEVDLNIEKNFLLGMKLFPRTKRVIFISDSSDYGTEERELARKSLSKYSDDVSVSYLSPPTNNFDHFVDDIASQPENSFIILSSWKLDNTGNYWNDDYYHPFLSKLKEIPVFGTQSLSIGSGIIGGYLTSMKDIGYKTAERAIKLARGLAIQSRDTVCSCSLVLDYNVITRLNIEEDKIPDNATFINKQFNLLDNYATEINFIILIIIILSLSLVYLAYYHFRFIRLNKDNIHLAKENISRKVLLDNTLSVMSEGVITFDSNLDIIDLNTAAKEMSGHPGTFIGQKFDDIFLTSQPNNEEPISANLLKALQDKERITIAGETRINYTDRESRIISGNISPVIDSDNNVSQVVFVFYDKTESYTQRRFLRLAAESAKSYTWVFNTLTKIITLDDNFFKYVGDRPRDESMLRFFISKIHPDDKDKVYRAHNRLSKETSREMFQIEFRISFDGGKNYEWWESRGIAFVDRSGKRDVRYIYGMDININEHKNREKELNEARLKAEESDKLKTAFLSNMSHEIRTPLNGLVGFANLLTDPDYSIEEKKRFVEVINESSRKLMSLIGDILDLSRIESNTMTFDIKPVDLSDHINEIVYSYRNQDKKSVQIVADLPPESITVNIDPFRNRQILANLIGNSLKFTETGEIKIGYTSYPGYVELYVTDTGIGIEKDKLSTIFERFFKVNEFVGGTGLGLSLCRAIVEKFGGRIWAESEFGAGTTVRYTINIDKAKNESSNNIIVQENIEKLSQPASQKDERPLILIAEDLDSNYQLLRIILNKQYRLLWAKNGEETVDMYKAHNPQLILMDIKMPVMDGLEATKIIRKYSKDVVIIAQTANAFESDHKIAIEAGCNEVITKPIRSSVLLAGINKYLKKSPTE